ncbi:MAG: hypothetical protein Q8P81_04480 [Nanoarchaeota archaeon]|nr:hypothetical protein [Nanoarchaeota archaeon]
MKTPKTLTALATSVILASGCAGVLLQKPAYERLDIYPSMETNIGEYSMHSATALQLKVIAGIYSGTARVNTQRTGNFERTVIDGVSSPLVYSETIEKVLRDADTDGNKLIKPEEAETLYRKVMMSQR